MPKRKTKKFIDKKNSVTFNLVHRSQKDPLTADETAPPRVLVPVDAAQSSKQDSDSVKGKNSKEELHKYGVYFDDDYDYLQHLRDVNKLSTEWERVENPNVGKDQKEKPKINLPSSVFASHVEEEVGLLNKAAPVSGPRLDYDPDVVAAMDDDFDFEDPENELEDNFMELAMEECSDNDENEEDDSDEYDEDSDVSSTGQMGDSDEERDEVASLEGPQYTFKDEETKSRFTSYSMSSSVIKRNEQLTLLDHKFEHMYAGYDDTEIGALDCEEIEGFFNPDSAVVLQCAKEFENLQKEDVENINELMKNRMKIKGEAEHSSSDDEDNLDRLVVQPREMDKWDCESFISTYSNIYNHPKLIEEPKGPGRIKIDGKTGIPKDVLNGRSEKLTAKLLAQLDSAYQKEKPMSGQSVADSRRSRLSVLSIRPENEKPEERKERKKALKEHRRQRRIERKANKEAFKEEIKKQEKIMLNNKNNVQGNRIL